MKKVLFFAVTTLVFATTALAAKTTYITTNHRFNFIKLKEVGGKVAGERQMSHPATVDEQGLRAALASINLARSYLIKKEVDTQRVFDDDAINFLAPALVRAFSKAGPNEEVVFSYLSKNPFFIIRNDRLNLGQAWIHNDELHIRFDKLYAKILGDVDKRGNEAKAIAKAQGLRVQLELSTGQKLGINDADEIVLDMHTSYVKLPEPEKPPTPITMSGEKPAEEVAAVPAPADKKTEKSTKKEATGTKGSVPVETAAVPAQKTPKDRLEELKKLRQDGLIEKKEYEEKKKEILKEL